MNKVRIAKGAITAYNYFLKLYSKHPIDYKTLLIYSSRYNTVYTKQIGTHEFYSDTCDEPHEYNLGLFMMDRAVRCVNRKTILNAVHILSWIITNNNCISDQFYKL